MVKTTRVAASILGILCLSACGGGNSEQHSTTQLSVESRPADVCVTMAGSDGEVGGLQMDLTWDSACMTVVRAAGSAAQCASNPSTGKSVETNLLSDAQMRALFLSVSDESPVSDGELFCCRFTVAPSQAGSCCSVNIGNLILASPTGGRIYDPGITVQASVGAMECDASTPKTPLPAPIPSPPSSMGS
ncbi:MAG: hypothetical protein ABSA52_17085 [Candidatus Binatia bacterium]|jgi:hypothetical protein